MRLTSALGLIAALATVSIAQAQPAQAPPAAQAQTARPAKQYTIEQFMNTTSLNGASFSADESKLLFSSNKTGIFNVYTVPVTGGEPTALTSSTTDSTYAVSYFRKDDRVLFTRDQGGNELNHLYVRTPDGQERDLTPGAKLKAQFSGWAPDGSAFYVGTNERDPRYFDLYRYDAKTYERTLLYKNEQGYFPGSGVGRREVDRADEGEHDLGLRHLSVERGHQGDDASLRAQGRRVVFTLGVRSQLHAPLLPDRRRQRVRAAAPLRPREEDARRRAEGGVGHRLHVVLANGPLSRHRGERRRPRRPSPSSTRRRTRP